MSEWQPIDTAPQDATEVLLWREDAGVLLGRWTCPEDFCTDKELAGLSVEDQELYGWFYADFLEGGRLDDIDMPTHWMPLPFGPPTGPKHE
jgi:hypothetical protein